MEIQFSVQTGLCVAPFPLVAAGEAFATAAVAVLSVSAPNVGVLEVSAGGGY